MTSKNKSPKKGLLSMIWNNNKIDAQQLLLLLKHDKKIRKEILSIVKGDDTQKKKGKTRAEPQENVQSLEKLLPFGNNFKPEQQLLNLLQEDRTLANHWITDNTPQDRQTVQLIVAASQWSNIQQLWKNIAKRCTERKTSSTKNEQAFLQGCIDLHNLQWKTGSGACLDTPSADDIYDHDKHQRAATTPTGDCIESIWLEGLINANGKLDKQYKPIVTTK